MPLYTDTMTYTLAGTMTPAMASLSLTNPTRCQKRVTLCLTGTIIKPAPGATNTFKGDGSLNFIRSVTLIADGTIIVQASPKNLFWLNALFQAGTSQFQEADINDTSGPTSFPFSWCLELLLDLPGLGFSEIAGLANVQSLQLDVQWGTLADVLVTPTGWSVEDLSLSVFSLETSPPRGRSLVPIQTVENVFPVLTTGNQFLNSANGAGRILCLAYLVRGSDTGATPPLVDVRVNPAGELLLIRGNQSELLVAASFALLQQWNLTRFGPRIFAPMGLGSIPGLAVFCFATDGLNGAIPVSNSLNLQTLLDVSSPMASMSVAQISVKGLVV